MKTKILSLVVSAFLILAMVPISERAAAYGVFQTAVAINLNTTASSNLKSANDVNYFKINVPYHGALSLSFSVGSANDAGNWVMLLYDENEKQLQMERVGSGGQVLNMIRTNKLDKLRLPPGEYYIKVTAYSTASFSDATYMVYAEFAPERSSAHEKEFNDTPETATNILLNAAVKGNLSSPEDRDYFRFAISDHREITIEFTTPDSVVSDMWTIYLQDSRGGVATYHAGRLGAAVNGFRNFVSEELVLDPGLYYIVVYQYEKSYSNEDYSLLLHSELAPVPDVWDDGYIYAYPTQVPDASYNVNIEMPGQIKNAGDFNNFDFGLRYSGSVRVDFITPSAVTKQSWILCIFDKNNKLFYSGKCGDEGEYNYSAGTLKKSSDKIRVPAGSYYVQILPINAYDYSTAAYRVKINYTPEAREAMYSDVELYETEYNDSAYFANELPFGSAMTANMNDYTDIDYFKFTLAQNSSVNISFFSPASVRQNNWVAELFRSGDTAAELVYKNYFGAEGEHESPASGYKKSLSKNIRLSPGTYYIKVSAYNIINYSNGDYRVMVGFTEENSPYGLYESEPNNTPETADLLGFNTDMTADISSLGDVDYFKICVDEAMEIQIKFTVSTRANSNFWAIKLYDSNQKEFKFYKVGEGGVFLPDNMKYFKTEKIPLGPGDYFVSILPYSKTEFSREEYTIKVLDTAGQIVDLYTYPADKPSDWALYEVGYAYGYGLVPSSYMKNFRDPIKREEFCMLAVRFLETTEKKPIAEILSERGQAIEYGVFDDTDDLYILSAYALGVVNGKGNRTFDPGGNITREEAAAMLTRVGRLENISINVNPLEFTDESSFAPWGAEVIRYVSGCMDTRGNRIMNGYTDGGFHPKEPYSRQQAFMTVFRLYAMKTGR